MNNLYNRPKTIFLDIDGVLVEHTGYVEKQILIESCLDGTIDKLREWDRKGYNIILTTGRRESFRSETENQLLKLGIFYDQLIMGIGGGVRVIINDRKSDSSDDTCIAINIDRNIGLKNIEI